ncbi:hypothetical protein L6261_03000 [Candidatus Parcubacteria bacterium]|nr:hypothetical protein [Candidatus Parcubacteria bacterium]
MLDCRVIRQIVFEEKLQSSFSSKTICRTPRRDKNLKGFLTDFPLENPSTC